MDALGVFGIFQVELLKYFIRHSLDTISFTVTNIHGIKS